MENYTTASIPILCKNGAWGDAESGRKLVADDAKNGIVHFTSESRVTLNQRLEHDVFGYTIGFKCHGLYFDVWKASRLNKHGLCWEHAFSAVFKAFCSSPTVLHTAQHDIDYWLRGKGRSKLRGDVLVRVLENPSLLDVCKMMWKCKSIPVCFPEDPLTLLSMWADGSLDGMIHEARLDIYKFGFGVEIEFTGISRNAAARVVANTFGVTKTFSGGPYSEHEIVDAHSRKWKIVCDGSIVAVNSQGTDFIRRNYKYELVTPILHYDKDIDTLLTIVAALKKRGAVCNTSCGIHIHVDTKFDANQLRTLVNIVASKEELVKKAIRTAPERDRYCQDLDRDFVEKINNYNKLQMNTLRNIWYGGNTFRAYSHYDDSRYTTLNLHSLFQGKGVEFRFFNSTLSGSLLQTYVLLTLAICHQAEVQKYASFKKSRSNDKQAMSNWLQQLGLYGEKYSDSRRILLQHLSSDRCRSYSYVA